MNRPGRVVLDTNVFISGFIFRKLSFPLVEAWRRGQFIWILSPQIQDEYFSVITRIKFRQVQKQVADVMVLLETAVNLGIIEKVIPRIKVQVIKKDPTGNIFIECALAGKTYCVVSGDSHLLDLGQYQGIPIVSLRTFLDSLL